MKKWLFRIGAVLAVLIVFSGWQYYKGMRASGFFRDPVYEAIRPDVPALQKPAVLVFSKTNGFIHKDALPAAKSMLEQIAKQQGWAIYFTDNGAVHNAEDLAKFNVVVWNNVSGDVLTGDQRTALQNYLTNGGGFVGIHGTGGDKEYAWKWYPETLLKAQFIGHPMKPQLQTATIRIEDSNDSIMRDLGTEWIREDEWYSFEHSPRAAGVHVLGALDEKTYSPKMFGKSVRMGDDHPIIWKHCIGRGPVFYSALGHTASTYSEPKYIGMITHAVAWAAGLEGSLCANGEEVERTETSAAPQAENQ